MLSLVVEVPYSILDMSHSYKLSTKYGPKPLNKHDQTVSTSKSHCPKLLINSMPSFS